jgi:bla regulator protein BlaR1
MELRTILIAAALAGLGALAYGGEVQINTNEVNGRYVDDFSNLSFVNDPEVLGEWVSVDFVKTPDQFVPGVQKFGGDLYLEGLKFLPNGKTGAPWFGWTKGVLMHLGGDHTADRYTIKDLAGAKYMFFEWKSGDYIIRHQKPRYYVLKKVK